MSSQTTGQIRPAFNSAIERRGLTNFEVAVQLDVTEKTVWRWRHGKSEPQKGTARRVWAWIASDVPQEAVA